MFELETSEDFDNLKLKDKVILDFYADWCDPCKKLGKWLKTKVCDTSLSNTIDILKVNYDNSECKDFITEYNIKKLPTIIFLQRNKKNYEVVFTCVGYDPKKIDETLNQFTKL